MERTMIIRTKDHSYPLYIGNQILSKLGDFLRETKPSKVCVVSDKTVSRLHITPLLEQIPKTIPHCVYIVPDGERAKTLDVFSDVITFALKEGLDRSSLFIAFGGGAVGDLTGFCAATFMRGIPFIQVPTTVLAHDSSVGGKTAVNHPMGKNLIGAFHHPSAVFFHLPFLDTLPLKERRSGFAEIIKAAFISDPPFIDFLQRTIRDVHDLKGEILFEPLIRGIETKKRLVEQDERERGPRSFLNFGHTLGHALESELGYGNITHGEAVLIGILFALRLSEKWSSLSYSREELDRWVYTLGFDLAVIRNLEPKRLLSKMKSDKKTKSGTCNFVLLNQLGKPVLIELDDKTILQTLTDFISEQY